MKMLYILNIANRVNSFSYTSMKAAEKLGIEYHIAGNWKYESDEERLNDERKYGIHIHQIDFVRTPYHPKNIKAYKQLDCICEKEKFDVIHCNTPIGGVVGRLLGRKYKVNTVIYQAHGFHFFDGAPCLNWMIYYPVEKILARFTDALITINDEDYVRAQKFHLKSTGKVYYVPGVGLDPALYVISEQTRKNKREELGLDEKSIALISAGDLVKRKNYEISIKALAKCNNLDIHYFICGVGPEEERLKALATQLGLENKVHFLGFRNDIKELLGASDIFLFTTLQEGLPRSLSEAMAVGLPCIVSEIRGNIDLIKKDQGGILCKPNDVAAFSEAINLLSKDPTLRKKYGSCNQARIKEFDIGASLNALLTVYNDLLF